MWFPGGRKPAVVPAPGSGYGAIIKYAMRRAILILFVALTVLLLAAGSIAVFLVNDSDFLKSRLADAVREQTGRELMVDGLLKLDIGRVTRLRA